MMTPFRKMVTGKTVNLRCRMEKLATMTLLLGKKKRKLYGQDGASRKNITGKNVKLRSIL